MTCSCPKCNAQIEFDPSVIEAEGSFNKCSECNANFIIRKESFAKRALHKGDEIYCAECGSHTGSSIYCQNCHAIYPDFLVTATSSAAKKQLGKILASFNIFKNIKIGKSAKSQPDPFTASHSPKTSIKGLKPSAYPVKPVVIIVAAILLFSAGGGYYWYQDTIATEYSENYVRAILGIKSARDLEIKISGRLATAMKAGGSPNLTADEQKSAASAKKEVDTLIKRIGKAPDDFKTSNDALAKLNDSFTKLHSAVASPAGMSDTYSAAVKKMDDDFRKSASELKAGLSGKISVQLAESTKKYKPLQDF